LNYIWPYGIVLQKKYVPDIEKYYTKYDDSFARNLRNRLVVSKKMLPTLASISVSVRAGNDAKPQKNETPHN